MTSNMLTTRLTNQLIHSLGNWIAPSGIGKGRLCIINYHRILESHDPLLDAEPDVNRFRWEMEILANCFNVMPLHDAVIALHTQRMPPRTVSITFDDGYRSTYDLAFPILKELNLSATIFVATGYIDNGNMWNDMIVEAVRQLPYGSYNFNTSGLGEYSIYSLHDRKHAIEKIMAESKYFQPQKRLELTQYLENIAGGNYKKNLMLTREMIFTLAQQGIEIGCHTVTHPILTSLDDNDAQQEITKSKEQLEKITGKPVRLFAYPNGKVGIDFDSRHVAMIKKTGFFAAFTTAIGSASAKHDIYQLPRCRPWDRTPFFYGLRILSWLFGSK